LRSADLVQLIRICRTRFGKVVLITNGVKFAMMDGVIAHLSELHDAGLSVLAISRHHLSETVNARLMNLETDTPALLQVCADNSETFHGLRRRLICVLQQGGVETVRDIDEYVEWATSFGVEEVCFKELYVSTSHESVYHSHRANVWSAKNQVPLSLVGDWAEEKGFEIVSRLPWGAPIFAGIMRGKLVRVAAYTEPSLFWERSNNIARSWNVMADGTCIASLEDRGSVITPNTVGHV
jgi:aryl-alcohol dehydrogenase-like predicted oxidoreductase